MVVYMLLAWVYTHLLEYALHRWVFHTIGRKRGNIFSFHWSSHHRLARKLRMMDGFSWKETSLVTLAVILHAPLAWICLPAYLTIVACGLYYIYAHNRSHLDPVWAMDSLPWHYAHHMGKDQNMNWGVRRDWVDRLMGTRVNLKGEPIPAGERYRL